MQDQDLNQPHEPLFSGAAFKLGVIHWYLLKASHELNSRLHIKRGGNNGSIEFSSIESTEFGDEVGKDEIHWWVFKKEEALHELKEKTNEALVYAQKLKDDAFRMKTSFASISTYDGLIGNLKDFAESHSNEITGLYEYVIWLYRIDILGPSILYAYRVWGTTRRSDRWIKVDADSLDNQDAETMNRIVETVFGLYSNFRYRIKLVRSEMEMEAIIANELNPDPIVIRPDWLLIRTAYEILDSIAEYFEMVRDSLRNILLDIEKCSEQKQLMKSDSFWSQFVAKAKDSITEQQLWDFKETLEMWHIPKGANKEDAKLKFAERAAGFANADGGVIVVGVSDAPPREIVGIGDDSKTIENRLKFTRDVIEEYIYYPRNLVYFHQLKIEDSNGDEKICLLVVIARSCQIVSVGDKDGRFTYPKRVATGLSRMSQLEISHEKIHLKNDSYDFIQDLDRFRRAQ